MKSFQAAGGVLRTSLDADSALDGYALLRIAVLILWMRWKNDRPLVDLTETKSESLLVLLGNILVLSSYNDDSDDDSDGGDPFRGIS